MSKVLHRRYGKSHIDSRVKVSRPTEPGGWWIASIPGVPGAYSQGHSEAEARAMLSDALREIGKA